MKDFKVIPFLKKHGPQIIIVILSITVLLLSQLLPNNVNSTNPVNSFDNLAGASTGALSSSWYCFDFNGVYSQSIQTELLLTSLNKHVVTGNYVLYGLSGQSQALKFSLAPRSFTVINLAWLSKASIPVVAVNLNGGGVAVEMKIQTANYSNFVGCTPQISNFGISSGGSTQYGNICQVAILNPTSQPAVVDVQAYSSGGILAPTQLQGLVINPNSISVEDLSQMVPNQNIEFIKAFVPSGASDIVMATMSYSSNYLLIEPAFGHVLNRVTFATNVNSENQVLTFINPTQNAVNIKIKPILQNLDSVSMRESIPPQSSLNVNISQITQIPSGSNYGLKLDLKDKVFAWLYNPSSTSLEFGYSDSKSYFAIPIMDSNSFGGQFALVSNSKTSVNIKPILEFIAHSQLDLPSIKLNEANLTVSVPIIQQIQPRLKVPQSTSLIPASAVLGISKGIVPDIVIDGSIVTQIVPVQVSRSI